MNQEANSPEFVIRPIEAADNAVVAHIIRHVMTEFGAVGSNFSSSDPEVDAMYEARRLYLRRDFESIDRPLGNTGHSGCNHWMVKDL